MLGTHKSVTDWHRYILQTLNNQMGLQVNNLDGKVSFTASSKLINHYSERFSLTGRVSVALVLVVLNSVFSILGFFLNSNLQEMKLIFHSICELVVLQSSI